MFTDHRSRSRSLFNESPCKGNISTLLKYRNRSPLNLRDPSKDRRIVFNVRGKKYETYEATLSYYPDTLLGNEEMRQKYVNEENGELTLSRDLQIFEAVLFYYQSKGILAKPSWVAESVFERELIFYQLKPRFDEEILNNSKYPLQCIWNLLENPDSSRFAVIVSLFSIITIVISIITFCLETVPSIVDHPNVDKALQNRNYLFYCESTIISWFTLEYILRVISAPKRLKFMTSFMGIMDFVIVLPYYIDIGIDRDSKITSLHFLRVIRMIRVFRVFKLTRYSTGLKVLGRTIYESIGQLVALFLCLLVSAVIFASVIFHLEHAAAIHDDKGKFESIPDSFWYVLITMTTVGYGDIIPQTILGRIVASFCMVCGIISLLCLPTPVFITHFGRFYELMIQKPFNEDDEIDDVINNRFSTGSGLFIPRWLTDAILKERRGTQYEENISLVIQNKKLRKACSRDFLHFSSLNNINHIGER